MTIVVDTSVAVKWLAREEGTERARHLLAIPDALIAPDWLLAEAASSFWKKVKKSELLVIHAERHIEDMPRFFQALHPAVDLVPAAFDLSIRLHHSVYDCIFVALALREDCRLATVDGGLIAAMERGSLDERVYRL